TVALIIAVGGSVMSAAAQGPSLPYRDPGACPFECCTYPDWTAKKDTTIVREMRDGPTRAVTGPKGRSARCVTRGGSTQRAGTATVAAATTIDPRNNIRVKKGDTLYLLTYQGEGVFKVWYKGRVITDVEIETDQKIKVRKQPHAVWWVKVRNKKGQVRLV